MKKVVLLFVVVFCFEHLFAQDPIVVDKLLYKQSDLTASTQPRLDYNGEACGLLKIITSDKSMTFEGSIMGDTQYKNGEYWVYIPKGTYQIRIKASGKEPLMLNFRDYNLKQVDSKATYELSFRYKKYDKINMKDCKIIQGPRLKKYAISILTLPSGLTIKYISALEYMKNIASVIAKYGDAAGDKQQCTILAQGEDGSEAYEYKLIIETMDNEESAIFGAAIHDYDFDAKIYEVIGN